MLSQAAQNLVAFQASCENVLVSMCLWVNALCVSNEYSVEVLLADTSSPYSAAVRKYRYRSLDTLLKAVDDTRGNHRMDLKTL